MNTDVPFLVALSSAPGIGPKKTQVLLEFFKSAQEVWDANKKDLEKILGPKDFNQFIEYREKTDVETNFSLLSKQGIKVLTILEDSYPSSLREISSPPPVIYYKGDLLSTLEHPCIAVVGTRLVSSYGRQVTEQLVEGLVAAGFTIVSGLARGVDAVAHRTAVDNHGFTVAVLGGGLNRVYPVENIKLATDIVSGSGSVISEFPPHQPPIPSNFPARNRIISGLCIGVLVTEAAEDSGSLITADFALEQGREVFAVPGPITSKLSKGPSRLLKMGAKLVSGVEDILEELNISKLTRTPTVLAYIPQNDSEAKILAHLEIEARSVDQLVKLTGFTTAQTSATLTLLEIKGVLTNLGTGVYRLK